MSKESRKAYRNMEKVKNQSSEVIKFNESTQRLTNQSKIFPETLKFEFKFFLMSISTLLSTSIYINKQYLNNYNFKLIFLLSIYLSRRVIKQIIYHYHIKQLLIFTINHIILLILIIAFIIDITYILYDLLINYSLYIFLSLFYYSLLQIPIFSFDSHIKYEIPPKEIIRMINIIGYYSVEYCYYAIFVPVFFSVKNNIFFNVYAIIFYIIFALINSFFFRLSFYYYKKSAEFHFYVLATGMWKKILKKDLTKEQLSKVKLWINNQHYEKDSIVEYKGKYYIGIEEKNFVEPNNIYMGWLYKLFIDPKKIFHNLLIFHGCFTITQCIFYIFAAFNIFSLTLIICSWFSFYEIYLMNNKIKIIFNHH